VFIATAALPEIDRTRALLKFSMNELYRNILSDIRADGVHRESSTHYHMIVLRSLLAARWNAEILHLSFPPEYDEQLERACEFAMYCHRPDGLIPALSDSDTGSYLDLLELAASVFSRSDFLYVATQGLEGQAPREKYVSFSESGYFIQRSGWGNNAKEFPDQRFLIFDCGPLGDGGHGHYDCLSIEIAAGGSPLIVDPGRYTYQEGDPNWRGWFKGTAAHNTVCVDETDQTPYQCGKPKGPVATSRLVEHLSGPNFDLLCGVVESPSYEAIHTRFIFFVNGEYWVIIDQIRGDRPHDYNLRFHLTPEAMNRTVVDRHQVSAPGVSLVFEEETHPQIESGWYAAKYGEKLAAPVISLRKNQAIEANFITLVEPTQHSDLPRIFRIHETSSDKITFEVVEKRSNRSTTDVVNWSASPQPFVMTSFRGKARLTWSRASGEGPAFSACDVEFTKAVANNSKVEWLTWDEQNGFEHSGLPTFQQRER
jgi:Heparinase II/III-like protein/Heparinase II/III N-terminus